jgi:uncharacterized Rmd1/YagE family protein
MRCTSYCIAEELNIEKLAKFYIEKGIEPKYFDDVLYIQKQTSLKTNIDVFLFIFGSVVIWGASEQDEEQVLEEIKKLSKKSISKPPFDLIFYKVDTKSKKTYIDEEANVIILSEDSEFLKLSISHALAQSVKLNVLENSVSNLLEKTAPLQRELAKKGTVSLSKKEISKNIGMLFSERYSINLHSDILDTPEFFWRRPSYEPIYLITAEFQDIQVRHNILNHRLDTIHELYSMLSNELNYKHSTRLEIIIIILIAIEVLIGLTGHGILGKLF